MKIRKSIFGGIAVCGRCGYSLCSSGTVYKGEREKYWFLSCNHKSKRFENPCEGVSMKYADLLEVVRQDLNSLIKLPDKEISKLVNQVLEEIHDESAQKLREAKIEKARTRLNVINRTIGTLYTDNAEGKLADWKSWSPTLKKKPPALKTLWKSSVRRPLTMTSVPITKGSLILPDNTPPLRFWIGIPS